MNVEDFYRTQWTGPDQMDDYYRKATRFSVDDMLKFANDYHTNESNQTTQVERMYSAEEVIAIVEKSRETGLTAEYLLLTEQFKKD